MIGIGCLFFILCWTFTFKNHSTGLLTSTAFAENIKKSDLIDRALEAVAMNKGDLKIRSDISTNPFALRLFKRWMENPLKAPKEAQLHSMELLRTANHPLLWLQELAKLGDIDSSAPIIPRNYIDDNLPTHLPNLLSEAIHVILDAIYTANIRLSEIKKDVSPENLALIEKYLNPDSCGSGDPEQHVNDPFRIKDAREAIEVAGDVDRRGILEAALTVMKALSQVRELLTKAEDGQKNVKSFSFMTGLGLVEIGGTGPDVYDKPASLIIDLGGNDLYRGRIASGSDGRSALVLDLSGDDIYLGDTVLQWKHRRR